MSNIVSRTRRPKATTDVKPLGRNDLLDLGLDLDHIYHRYIELGSRCCPTCEHDHIVIKWDHYLKGGWEWRCQDCGQDWREPKITKGNWRDVKEHGSKKAKMPKKEPHPDTYTITKYKY